MAGIRLDQRLTPIIVVILGWADLQPSIRGLETIHLVHRFVKEFMLYIILFIWLYHLLVFCFYFVMKKVVITLFTFLMFFDKTVCMKYNSFFVPSYIFLLFLMKAFFCHFPHPWPPRGYSLWWKQKSLFVHVWTLYDVHILAESHGGIGAISLAENSCGWGNLSCGISILLD